MQLLGYIVLACLVIAAAQAVLAILIIMLLIAGLICRPRETFGFLVIGGLLNLLQFYPVATICVGGALLAIVLIANARPRDAHGQPADAVDGTLLLNDARPDKDNREEPD